MSYRWSLNALAPALMLSVLGCQSSLVALPPADNPSAVVQASAQLPIENGPIVRGQSPLVTPVAQAPWGDPYLAPGELSCQTPPPFGYELPPYGPPPIFGPPPVAQQPVDTSDAGWLEILPPNGGAISPDFGLPREATVANRVPNPIYIPVQGSAARTDATWEAAADVLRDYFPIQSEQNVRLTGGVLTEGRFETPWQTGATLFEPWRNDSVGAFNRWQSALQTIRRKATVRVIPAAGGYEIGVQVNKQLEDLNRPELASAGAAALRNDASLPTDRLNPIDRIRASSRWIDIGRDEPLEQEMLRRFRERLAVAG